MNTSINTCPSCGAAVNAGARFCISCGHSLSESTAGDADASAASYLATERGMPLGEEAAGADEGTQGATVSASIGSTPEDAMAADALSEPGLDVSASTASQAPDAPSTDEGSAAFIPGSASENMTFYTPGTADASEASGGSEDVGSDTSVQAGQPQTPSTQEVGGATSGISSPAASATESEQPSADSWYDSLSSSPGGSISSDTLRISPISDATPSGSPTVNISEQSASAASASYSPPASQTEPLSSASAPAFTPPPAFNSAPMQPPGGQPVYTPPTQQGQGQSYYAPPAQQFQGQQPYAPPPQYNQAPPKTQMQGYGNYPPVYPGYGPQPGAAAKDPTTALLLELIGYVGILGIGHIYAGRTNRGIALLIGWILYLSVSGVLTLMCVGCAMLLIWPLVPIGSGLWIKNDLEKERAMGMQR